MDDPLLAEIQARMHEHPLLAQAAARITQLREALAPFADIGAGALDVQQDPTYGYAWGGLEQRQRITVWFGPSDFGHAIAAYAPPPSPDTRPVAPSSSG